MPRKPARPEPVTLIAKIETVEQTYYISEYADHKPSVSDEAIIDIVGRIEQISPSQKQHGGREIEISLVRARSFERGEENSPSDRPFMLVVNLRKGGCSLMAYLPSDAFWALPPMIASGSITHIEARFEPPHRGSGNLLSLYFAPAQKVMPAT